MLYADDVVLSRLCAGTLNTEDEAWKQTLLNRAKARTLAAGAHGRCDVYEEQKCYTSAVIGQLLLLL